MRSEAGALTATVIGSGNGIRRTLNVKSSDLPIEVACPVEMLQPTLRELGEREITLEQSGNHLVLTDENGSYKINGESIADFPRLHTLKDRFDTFSLNGRALKRAIDSVVFSVSSDELRPAMCGIYLEADSAVVNSVATDGHQIAVRKNEELKLPSSIILHRESARLLSTILDTDAIDCQIQDNNLVIRTSDTEAFGLLVSDTFPAYKMVMPSYEAPCRVMIPKAKLTGSVKRAGVYSDKSQRAVVLEITGQSMRVISRFEEQERTSEETLSVDHSGPDMKIAFNTERLLQVISATPVSDKEDVVLEFDAPNKGGYVRAENAPEFKSLLMPLQIAL